MANLGHQTQQRFCHFLVVSLFSVSLVKSYVVTSWESDICLLFNQPHQYLLICLAG